MKTCPSCQQQVADSDNHCGYCGGSIPGADVAQTAFGMPPVQVGVPVQFNTAPPAAAPPAAVPPVAAPRPAPVSVDMSEDMDAVQAFDDEDQLETVALPSLDPALMAELRAESAAVAEGVRQQTPEGGATEVMESIPAAMTPPPVAAAPQPLAAPIVVPSGDPEARKATVPPAQPPPAEPPLAQPPLAQPPAAAAPAQAAPAAAPVQRAPKHSDVQTLIMDSPLEGLQEMLAQQRAEKEAALAAPQLDFDDAPPDLDHGETGRSIAWVGLVAVPLIGAIAAAAIFFGGGQLIVRGETRYSHDAAKDQYNVDVAVIIEEGDPKEQLVLEFRGDRQEFEGNRKFTYKIPRKELKVGFNPMDAVVKTPDGTEVGRFPMAIPVDYEFEVKRTVLGPDDKDFTALFRVADGANLFFERADVGPSDDGRLAVKVRLDDVLKNIDTLPSADYPYSLRFKVRRADGSEVPSAQQVRLTLPTVPLTVLRPARETTTASKKLQLVGRTDPGAVLMIGERRVRTGADGSFTHRLTLAMGDNDVVVASEKRGVVDAKTKLDIRRVTKAELAELHDEGKVTAEDWAGKEAVREADYAKLKAGAAGPLKGKKVALTGQLFSLQQGPERAVLLVNLCGKGELCLVWAETEARITVDVDAKATIYGTLTGSRKLPADSEGGGEAEVPVVEAQIVVGD